MNSVLCVPSSEGRSEFLSYVTQQVQKEVRKGLQDSLHVNDSLLIDSLSPKLVLLREKDRSGDLLSESKPVRRQQLLVDCLFTRKAVQYTLLHNYILHGMASLELWQSTP